MGDSRIVCLACRSKLLLASASTARSRPRWPLSVGYATASPNSQPDGRNDEVALDTHSTTTTERPESLESETNGNELIRRIRPQRDFSKQRERWAKSKRSSSLSVFERVVHDQKEQKELEANTTSSSVGFDLYQNLAKLKEMRDQPDASLVACFEYFDAKIRPEMHAKRQLPRIFRASVSDLLDDVCTAKQRGMTDRDLPTVTNLTTVRREVGMFIPDEWTKLIMSLIEEVCRMSTSPQDFPSIESFEGSQARREVLLQDLVGAWRIFSLPQFMFTRSELLQQASQDFRLPSIDMDRLLRIPRPNRTSKALCSLFPRFVENQLTSLSPAILATLVLLTDPIKGSTMAHQAARGFLQAVSQILAAMPLDRRVLPEFFFDHVILGQYVIERWSTVCAQLKVQPDSPQRQGARRTSANGHRKHSSVLHKQLGQALKSRDLKAVERAWGDFWGPSSSPEPERAKDLRAEPEMFDYFIMVYTTMRQPNQAVSVWNSLGKVGLAPSIKTWNSLIEGCKRASNAAGIRNVWSRLIESGIQLDTTIWTARVSGLIEAGDPEGGLQALDEMGRIWDAALKNGHPPLAVKPTIEPVNAAIAGLLRYGALDAAQKVLAWGSRHGIEPDIITFNTILRPLVRQGASGDVDKVFAMMKSKGVQADVATFTIILDGAMTSLGEEEPEQQIETVKRILAEMEAAGLEANLQTYGRMIYLLLQEGDRANESVKAVLAHIWGKGLELSSHIYTMLAEHYFSRDPPDLNAVRDLIENRGLYNKFGIDRVFWERVVRGYSQAGDTINALKAFGMIESSLSVTTSTLSDLLQALINNQQWDEARKLVQRAKSQREQSQSETSAPDARFWKHRFWHLVSEYGLLEGEGAQQ